MAFLGVNNSITGRKWIGPNDEQHRRAEAISQITGQKPPVASVLARLAISPEKRGYVFKPSYQKPTTRSKTIT